MASPAGSGSNTALGYSPLSEQEKLNEIPALMCNRLQHHLLITLAAVDTAGLLKSLCTATVRVEGPPHDTNQSPRLNFTVSVALIPKHELADHRHTTIMSEHELLLEDNNISIKHSWKRIERRKTPGWASCFYF